MSLIKKLAGETIIYGISSILPRILHFTIFTIYFTWKFENQSDFGIYRDLYAYATILLVIMIFRMDTALFRFGSRDISLSKVFGNALLPILLLVTAAVSLMYLNADKIASLLSYQSQSYYVKWFAFILGFDALAALAFARFRLENKAKRFMVLKLLNTGVMIIIVLFFLELCPYLSSKGFTWFEGIYQADQKLDYVFVSNLIASALVFVLVLPVLIRNKFDIDRALIKKMLWYAFPLVIVGLAGNINTAFAAPLQKYFLGDNLTDNLTQAGIYAAPAALAIFLNLFTTAFNYAAEPFFFKQYKQSNRTQLFGKVALLYTIIALFVLLLIVMNVDLILKIMGKNYRSATEIVPILLFANIFLGLYYNFAIWYKLRDMTYVGAIISILGAVITLGISISLLPQIGYLASAWAALVCFSFMSVVGYLTGQHYYPIQYPIVRIVRQLIIAAVLVYISERVLTQIELSLITEILIKSGLILSYVWMSIILEKTLIRELFYKDQAD